MRRHIIVFFVSLFWLALPSAWGADRGALFKVESEGRTLYLFGTMHVGQPGFYPLESRIVDAVAGASALALEIDPGQDPAVIAEALKTHGMIDPASKAAAMPPALRARLNSALEKAGLEPAGVAHLRPWLVATVLAMGEYAAQGYLAELSVDAHMAKLARARKVPVVALETVHSQMSLFNRLSDAEQLRLLDESLTMIENGKQSADVARIVNAWRTADRRGLDEIAALAASDTTLAGKFLKKVLLDERNVVLADKLAAMLKQEKSTVAAIGVLHLVGSNSVPALLGERGLRVERIY